MHRALSMHNPTHAFLAHHNFFALACAKHASAYTWAQALGRVLAAALVASLAACGGGGGSSAYGGGSGGAAGAGGSEGATPAPLAAVIPSLDFSVQSAELSWPAVEGASVYKVYQTVAGQQVQVASTITPSARLALPVRDAQSAQYAVQACRGTESSPDGCGPLANPVSVKDHVEALNARAVGYFKASQTAADAQFGSAVALSADGSTLAVGAPGDPTAPDGIVHSVADGGGAFGVVYIFAKDGNGWRQTQVVHASDALDGDRFGAAVALSADGTTLAVGAPLEISVGRGVNADNNFNFNDGPRIGAVYVYTRKLGVFTDEVYLKGSGFTSAATQALAGTGMQFGTALALSSDGDTLAVGAVLESTSGAGPNRSASRSKQLSGAAFVFARREGQWREQSLIKALNPGDLDRFGAALALSSDGNTLAVGAPAEDGSSDAAGGVFDDLLADSGAVYVYRRKADVWAAGGSYIKALQPQSNDQFGSAVALSEDGASLLVGAPADGQASPAGSGAAYVFTSSAERWTQTAYLKAPHAAAQAGFGAAVGFADQGRQMAVGAPAEGSAAIGINGDQTNTAAPGAGAAYTFRLVDGAWVLGSYLKANNTRAGARFGTSLAQSADGSTLVAGAAQEAGCGQGIVADVTRAACSAPVAGSGAVYLY